MTLDDQILAAEAAEQKAQVQYQTHEAMFLESQEVLRRARQEVMLLRNRREVLVEIGCPHFLLESVTSAPLRNPGKVYQGMDECQENDLQCARCRAWLHISATEHCDGVGVVCRPCAAIIRRVEEQLQAALDNLSKTV